MSERRRRIIMTGGGPAGHVMPNIALLPELRSRNYAIAYIGSEDGIEKDLIKAQNIRYYGIKSGKFRRYFSFKNFTDPFKVLKGYNQAKKLLKKMKPDVVFSKGGFVSVPVVMAAGKLKIPVIIHESDMTPGLANRIAIKRASIVCTTFPETLKYISEDKHPVLTGTPIRKELLAGNAAEGHRFTGLPDNKPTILCMGGSTGAVALNEALHANLNALLKKYNVVHLCGKDKADREYDGIPGYVQYEYIDKEMKDLLAMSDMVVSRAGANAIFEFLTLKKHNLLIPLPAASSRGDQILNAESFEKSGYSKVLFEEDITPESLLESIEYVFANKDTYIRNMAGSEQRDAIGKIIELIESV